VTHELKTPLTSIKGFVETLANGAIDDTEDALRFLGIISKHVDRLNAIIDDLLTLSRIEQEASPDSEVVLAPGTVAEPIRDAVQLCSVAAGEKGISINVDCPEDIAVVMNAALVEQCVVNLLDNAVKYSDAGGEVDIVVREQPDGMVSISVRDRGAGISSEHLGRLFERFYRVDKARSRGLGGTGLGLSIVRHIVDLHGGAVDVQSELGSGSTFRILLRAVPAATTSV
jgi:two-component system phosphate regulon sensor histidine kinase PhoR